MSVAFSPDGRRIVSGGFSNTDKTGEGVGCDDGPRRR